MLYFQACLRDFQSSMKTAKNKESASLPRQPQSQISRPLDLEEGGGANERTSLLQVRLTISCQDSDLKFINIFYAKFPMDQTSVI